MGKMIKLSALSKKLAKKKKERGAYKQGDATEKTWINFQITKQLKRDFRAIYEENKKLNASEHIRQFMLLIIENKGDIDAVLKKGDGGQNF